MNHKKELLRGLWVSLNIKSTVASLRLRDLAMSTVTDQEPLTVLGQELTSPGAT